MPKASAFAKNLTSFLVSKNSSRPLNARFNPHRPFRAGATAITLSPCNLDRVSILTGPFGPVQRCTRQSTACKGEFQSSPALSGWCNGRHPVDSWEHVLVSILTGPFGPVQPAVSLSCGPRLCRFNPHRPFRAGATLSRSGRTPRTGVSILTGPFGLVQLQRFGGGVFATGVSILTGPFGPVQRRAQGGLERPQKVSILTGPFGPVQRARQRGLERPQKVSILTGPFGPVQQLTCGFGAASCRCFNPHRPFRAGAT